MGLVGDDLASHSITQSLGSVLGRSRAVGEWLTRACCPSTHTSNLSSWLSSLTGGLAVVVIGIIVGFTVQQISVLLNFIC